MVLAKPLIKVVSKFRATLNKILTYCLRPPDRMNTLCPLSGGLTSFVILREILVYVEYPVKVALSFILHFE